MTEAMSRREIEDVLTSIKRLVSQDAKSRPSPAPAVEKLVLTPSLRVKEPAPSCDAAVVPSPDLPLDPHEPQDIASADNAHALSEPADDTVPEPADKPAEDPAAGRMPGKDGSLIRRIAQAGLLRDAAAADCTETVQTDAVQVSQPAPEIDPQVSEPPTDIIEPQASDADIEETLARLEAVLSGQTPPERPAAPTDLAPPDPSAAPAGEQIIDEGMLYQLVAHIVRQELQGELGEKITRNIRKLVRSEVARELQLRRP